MASIQRIGAPPGSGLPARRPGNFGLGTNTGAMLKYLTDAFAPSVRQPGLAPLTPKQIGQQATGYVTAALAPQEKEIQAENARTLAGGVGSIRGGTTNYAAAMKPYAGRAAAIGREQAGEDTAETGALADFLRGSGADTFGDVASKLQSAGIEAPAAPNLGAGSAGITSAVGIANARAAGAEGATNAELANLLPGFAELAGQQAENQFRGGQANDLATRLGQLESQAPGLEKDMVNTLTSNETTKANVRSGAAQARAQALAAFLGNSVDDATQTGIANATGLFGVQKAAADASKPVIRGNGTSGIYKIDPVTGKATTVVKPHESPASRRVAANEQRGAMSKADSTIRSILTAAYKTAAKRGSASAGPFGTGKTGRPEVGGADYNEAVNAAVTSAATILGPYMSHDDIVRFVQQRALHAGWAQPPKPQPNVNPRLDPNALGPPAPLS